MILNPGSHGALPLRLLFLPLPLPIPLLDLEDPSVRLPRLRIPLPTRLTLLPKVNLSLNEQTFVSSSLLPLLPLLPLLLLRQSLLRTCGMLSKEKVEKKREKRRKIR